MANETLKTVKDCEAVFSNGQFVFLAGKKLWLFRADGSFVAKYKKIRNPAKVVFLAHDTALVDGHGDGSYHYISLVDGGVIWSSMKKGRRSRSANRFAISPDGTVVYDLSYVGTNTICIDKIIPTEHHHGHYTIKDGLRVTHDIFCDESGLLCLLQSHIASFPNDSNSIPPTTIEQNGIMAISINNDTLQYHWERLWESVPKPYTSARGCDGHSILRTDLTIQNLDTMEVHNLLLDCSVSELPSEGFEWSYEPLRKLLTVCYLVEKVNIVIDCENRNVVAKYYRSDWGIGFRGCVIGNEFWLGSLNGIIRKPFPFIEVACA